MGRARSLSELSYPQLLLLVFGLVVVVTLVVAASTSGVAFGAYTPTWEGGSELRSIGEEQAADTTVVTNATRYGELDADGTVAFVLAPVDPYGDDAEHVRGFVEGGGTLVVADSTPTPTNELLADVGATAAIDGDPLRDERRYDRSPAMPIATTTGDHRIAHEVDELVLNHGSAIVANDATVVADSSEYAYLDRDRTGELDDNDRMDARPVVTHESVGDGDVVVISDPSVFINVMLDRGENRAFAEALIADHERVVIDTSHTERPPPLITAVLTLRDSAPLQFAVAIAAVAVVAGWERGYLARLRRSEADSVDGTIRPDERTIRAYFEAEFPEWDDERRERVVAATADRRPRSERAESERERKRRSSDDKS